MDARTELCLNKERRSFIGKLCFHAAFHKQKSWCEKVQKCSHLYLERVDRISINIYNMRGLHRVFWMIRQSLDLYEFLYTTRNSQQSTIWIGISK